MPRVTKSKTAKKIHTPDPEKHKTYTKNNTKSMNKRNTKK